MNAPHYVSRSLISLWFEHGPRTMDLPTAFAVIRYSKTNDNQWQQLLAAAIPIHALVTTKSVKTTSKTQMIALLTTLELALEPFRTTNWFTTINPKDPWWAVIRPYYEFYAPVVPDPLNGIDLRAFAFDTQSVHRSSTQKAMQDSLVKLRAIPIPEGMDAVEEFLLIDTDLNPYSLIKDVCTLTVSLSSGPVSYAETFNHLWAYIRSHEHKSELVKRLSEELLDSVNVCANGKLARLVNVVEGYMEGVSTANQKELFQNRMAVIAKMEKSEQLEAATKAFKEFEISEDEQEAWLEALED